MASCWGCQVPAGEYSVGKWKWSARYGSVAIKYNGSGDWKTVKADGKNDSRQTWLGRKNAEIEIESVCKDDKPDDVGIDGEINNYARQMIRDLNPRGPNGGKPFAWSEDDQDAFNVYDVTVDHVTLKRTPGAGSFTVSWKLSSWVKPVAGPVVSKTPKVAGPWSPGPVNGPNAPKPTPKTGFSKTPPVVKP